MKKVFIDGEAGTTGLRIHSRLSKRGDIELIHLPSELRKDPAARKEALNGADVAFLCLPDAASIEAVSMIENPATVVIDTSTAHRVAPGWTYGFPELPGQREAVAASTRIANPGCHASGFVALVKPLVHFGVLSSSAVLSCTSLTGYSGGGKKMIAQYEADLLGVAENPLDDARYSAVVPSDGLLQAPRLYGLSQLHKHLPEMVKVCGLDTEPYFCPIVAPYYSGMEVIVTMDMGSLSFGCGIEQVRDAYRRAYADGLVHYVDACDEEGFLSASAFSGRDDMQVSVWGNEGRIVCVSRFDNLGKGASGAAIQNLNIVLGVPEGTGLVC